MGVVGDFMRGLSPRVRGSPARFCRHQRGGGIIPACAGKPRRRRRGRGTRRDYPRVCGEAGGLCSRTSPAYGLSPRVRGSHAGRHAGRHRGGIIPACAGKPRASRTRSAPSWDYPRVCGEAFGAPALVHRFWGLSPRVRGSRVEQLAGQAREGIIPACAGKPYGIMRPVSILGDYPRVCGEAIHGDCLTELPQGLSPRVRGSHDVDGEEPVRVRIIPACAGKPVSNTRAWSGKRDYPRVCGEATASFRPSHSN